jgi:teichoic acid transport system ATP-binding protein
MTKLKVKLEHISKAFPMYERPIDRILDLMSLKRNKHKRKQFYALRDISFDVYEGETVGIIGLNGSGKSTLSNIIAEIIQLTRGKLTINGETSLIAISAGLNNNLTGIENIELKCLMHGLTKERIEEIKDEIIDFADVGEHIHQPVKNYSSGMRSKLGFSIAVSINPDILIIDEALSVGDSTFTEKSLNKMKEFKEKGKTIFFISHSASQVKDFCDRAIWIHYGQLKEDGEVDTVITHYNNYVKEFNAKSEEEKKAYKMDMRKNQIIYEEKIKRTSTASEKLKTLCQHLLIWVPVIVLGIAMVITTINN